MSQQAELRNGGFPCDMSVWAGLHYSQLYGGQTNRHEIGLFQNWLIFSVSFSIRNHVCPEGSLIGVCTPVLSVWPSWNWTPFWLWMGFTQSFLIGASVPAAVLSTQGVVWITSFGFQQSQNCWIYSCRQRKLISNFLRLHLHLSLYSNPVLQSLQLSNLDTIWLFSLPLTYTPRLAAYHMVCLEGRFWHLPYFCLSWDF